MKLADHVDKIRRIIDTAFRNRLGRMGIREASLSPIDGVLAEYRVDRERVEAIYETLLAETNNKAKDAYEKLVEEFTFTLFNRIAALKVMEAHTLHPEIVTRRTQHGGRSFAHLAWLEQNPEKRNEELEGLVHFLEDQLQQLSGEIKLFSLDYPYHLLPTAIELNQIIDTFNAVEDDSDVEENIWQSDDVMGWLYESYNNYKKIAHKESKAKTEYDKVAIQSQVYTPRWVVKFLVDNSLGKLYLEMFPHSAIKDKYQIANAPTEQVREPKPLTDLKIIDPACGSANFLLYAFDLFYDLYLDQIENYGAAYDERKIPELIIHNNLHGVDLDDRAVQLAQFGLYIKAKRRRRTAKIEHFNVVSSDFFLPEYAEVKGLFETDSPLDENLEKVISELWSDLQTAHKFGALIQLEEKFNARLESLIAEAKGFSLPGIYEEKLEDYYKFRTSFFDQLQTAVGLHNKKYGLSFLGVKTADALTYLKMLTRRYDVAMANPPYTDSSAFGSDLKRFIETNYSKPYRFNTNLYATFILRCCELTDEAGKVALVHMPTFMYIKSFIDVRKYIVEKMHISLFVEWGYLGMFNPSARVDSAMFVMEKHSADIQTTFIKLDDLQEGARYKAFTSAYSDLLEGRPNKHTYTMEQRKLRSIAGYPFIYWISESFREKFSGKELINKLNVQRGCETNDNDKFLRFWWEISKDFLDLEEPVFLYSKGGRYNKWAGNLWLTINLSPAIKREIATVGNLNSQEYYGKKGITYTGSGQKGASFRFLPEGCAFDVGGSSIFPGEYTNIEYAISFLNSKLSLYILDCLNPTVNIQINDIKRIPFVLPSAEIESKVQQLGARNILIKNQLNSYQLFEPHFIQNPIIVSTAPNLRDRLLSHLNYENCAMTLVLVNEALINELVFEVYALNTEDRKNIEEKFGKLIARLPVSAESKNAFLQSDNIDDEYVREFVHSLAIVDFENETIQALKAEFCSLYQSSNDFEEFCTRHQINPINVWYWFYQSNVLPAGRSREIALEFLADVTRNVLMEDHDGIVPLVGLPGEPALIDRIESECLKLGLTAAQFAQLDSFLGRSVNEYLEHYFFNDLSYHLNLFLYLPKTPFIWHISSGEHQGFEAYIIIYKWNRDSLYKLKTTYIARREEALQYRLSQLADGETAQAQTEKDKIRLQLQEISDFTKKVDELIAEGYDPKLDDGVGKNIAPLQKKGMLRADVLNAKQLEKYLNADW